MIVCEKKKLCFFLAPKTGTTSIIEVFQKINRKDILHTHKNYLDFLKEYPNEDPLEYKFFCFYRDPIDRLLSMFQQTLYHIDKLRSNWFIKRNPIQFRNVCETPQEFIDLMLHNRSDSRSFIIENMTDLQMYYHKWNFSSQSHWLDHKNINMTILDFRDFEENVRFIVEMFFGNNVSYVLPNHNKSKIKTEALRKDLTEIDIDNIKKLYYMDYEFFESKGINFV